MRGAHNAKRALLILSDGGDNHSRYNENDIKRLVKEADTQLYAIGLYEPLGYRNRTPEELNGPSLLADITELTGGRVFAVEHLNDLPDVASKIGMELRNQYVLGYKQQAITSTTPGGEKSKSSFALPKGFRPSRPTPKPATTRLLTEFFRVSRTAGFSALALLLLLTVPALRAQLPVNSTPPPPPPDQDAGKGQTGSKIQVDVNLVVLHTTVLDDRGKFVEGLTQDNFRVSEDKVEQKLSVFKREDIPSAWAWSSIIVVRCETNARV